jgi:hypothetical protein
MGPSFEPAVSEFFASGHVVDMVLGFVALEVLVLCLWAHVGMRRALQAILPGFFLLLALRTALTGAHWTWTALWLALSLPAHLADLARRRP